MAARDDFGSNSRSPGGWGGTGTGSSMSGMGGQKASNYNYSVMPTKQQAPTKIGNWNTGGVKVGVGNQYGVGTGYSRQPYPGGYAGRVTTGVVTPPPPAALPPAVDPVVAALARRFQPSIGTAPQGVPGDSGYYDMREALGYQPNPRPLSWPPGSIGHGSTWGAGYQPAANQTVGKTGGVVKDQSRVPAPSWGDSGSYNYGGRR